MSTTEAYTDTDTDATESTEPTVADTKATDSDTVEIATDDELLGTTETSLPTATTPRPASRTTRAEGSTAGDLARQYAELEGDLDLDDEEDEPARILLLQLPSKPELIAKYYDLRALAKQVDWYILPSHHLTDDSEQKLTYHPSRLLGLDDLLNADSLVDLLTGLGAPKAMVVVSFPVFALRFTLQDETRDTPRSPVLGAPEQLNQQQLCALLSQGGWSLERDQDLTAPYAFKNASWVAFEDHTSVDIKAKYIQLRELGGLAVHSVDSEDWLQTSCKPPVQDDDEDDDVEDADAEVRARTDEGQVAGSDGDDGSYRGEDKKKPEAKEEEKEEKKATKKKVPAEPMPMTLLETAFRSLAESSRRTRAALLSSLEDDIHQHAVQYSDYTGSVQLSPYQITRVVDREGAVHVVRRSAQTEFECSRQGYFVHPLSCNRFYRCVKFNQQSSEFTVFEFDCPAGLAFDETVEVCVWPGSLPEGSACKGSSEIAPIPRAQYGCPNAEGYYADPENCRWFFACLDHARDGLSPLTAYEFRCPFGLVFDEGRQMCDWPWLVQGCGNAGAAAVRYQGVQGVRVANYEGLSLLSAGFGNGAVQGNAGVVGNTLYSANDGAAGYAADASFQSASYAAGGANSGYAYNSPAADVNANLASSSQFGQSNGYIALQAAQAEAEAGSRYEDRGYGGFATFPASQVSGGRSQGSSGVVLGSNLHTLQGIQGVGVGASSSSGAQGSYDYSSGSSAAFGAKQSTASAGYDASAGSAGYGYSGGVSSVGVKQSTASAGYGSSSGAASAGYDYSGGASSFGAKQTTASGGYDYNAGSSSFGAKQSSASTGSGYSFGAGDAAQKTTAGYAFGSDSTASTVSGYSSGADLNSGFLQSIHGVQVDSDGSSGYSSAGVGVSSVTVSPIVSTTAYSVTPAPAPLSVVSSTPAAIVSQRGQGYQTVTQAVTATPGFVSYQSPTASTVAYKQFELQQPLVAVPAVTPSPPSLVSYQSVLNQQQHQHEQQSHLKASVSLSPEAPTLYTYKKYEVKQPLVHFQSVTPAPVVATASPSPAFVSVTPAYEVRPAVQPVTAAPAFSFIHKQTPAPSPALALAYGTPSAGPAVYSFQQGQQQVQQVQQVQHVQQVQQQAVTPVSVDHSVQYSYSTPAPFSLKNVKYHRIVDIQQEPNGYHQDYKTYNHQQHAQVQSYQQEVQQVQPVVPVTNVEYQAPAVQYQQYQQVKQVQPVVPVTKVEYQAPAVQYQQYQQEVKQVQPVVPITKVEYQAPAVQYQQYQHEVKQVQPVVQYQQEIKQVQPVVPVSNFAYQGASLQYQQEVKQVQPVVPVTKVEYHAPTVQYQQYHQNVKQVQPVVQYQQEIKQVQPVVPVTKIEYQAPAVQYQQVKQIQPVVPVTKFEYKTPAFQYQNLQQYKQYKQEVQQVQPVVPVVQYQQEVKQVQPVVTRVEYQQPAVQYQQYHQEVKQVQPVVQYQQVKQVQPVVTKVEYQQPAVQYQQYHQEVKQVQPAVQYQQVKQVQPVVTKVEYQQPAVQYQQYQQYQQGVKQVQPVVQYQQEVKLVQPAVTKVEYQQPAVQYQQYQQEVKQVQPVVQYQQYQQEYQQKQLQYPVKAQEVVYSYSTPSNLPIRQQAVKAVKLDVTPAVTYRPKLYPFVSSTTPSPIREVPLLHSYSYEEHNEPSTPVPCTTCSHSTAGLRLSSTPAPFQYNYVSSTPKYQAAFVNQYSQSQVSSTPSPVQYNLVSSGPKYQAAVVSQVSSTPAPVQYNYVSSTPKYQQAAVVSQYSESQVSSTPSPVQYNYVSSAPKYQAAVVSQVSSAPEAAPCVSCSQSTAGLRVSSTPAPFEYNYVSSTPKYQAAVVSQVSSTPAPVQYNYVSSAPKYQQAAVVSQYSESQVSSTPSPVQYVSSAPKYQQAAVVSQYSQGQVSSTPAPIQYNYVSSTPKYESSVVSQVSEQQSGQYEVQQQTSVDEEEPPVALFVQTAAPPPAPYNQVVYSSTRAPVPTRYTVVQNYETARPEVYSQQYYTTPAPVSVTKTIVSEVATPAAYVEQNVYGAKTSSELEYSYEQGQQEVIAPTAAPTVDVYPIAPEAPATVEVQYQTTPTPARRLRPSTTAAAYVEEQQQVVSEGYGGDVVVSSTPARGNIRYGYEEDLQQQIDAEEAVEDDGYGVRKENAYSGLVKVVESSTLSAIGAVSRGHGRVRVGSSTTEQYNESDQGYYSSTTEGYGSSTVRAKGKGRKRTKIVVVTRLSDVNPLLIGKLGAQCSCAENGSARRNRPGVKRVISRVRVVRPKDGDVVSSTEGYASSTTEGYVSSTTEARAVSSTKQAEIEEDLALIRDAEKSDAEEDDDDNPADFGAVVVSRMESSSSAAYDEAEIVSSTVASRGRGRARGRTTYIRAGKAKSTIYVSTTAEPDDDDEQSLSSSTATSTVYEASTASSRRSVGRRTTARSIQINSKDDEDEDAVFIKPRPRSRSRPSPRLRSRARSDNDIAPSSTAAPSDATSNSVDAVEEGVTPGPGHTVDLGVNGVVECRRPGLFRHPELCNKFYSCNWDKWKKKYAVNVFNCPIHLAYDTTIGACNWPSKGPACVNGKLLV